MNRALIDGYQGLFATGDMSWEMGLDRDLKRLLEYEWNLEKMFEKYPTFSGICQYHAETLPNDMVCHAVLVHPAMFINHTLARLNPKYIASETPIQPVAESKELNHIVKNLCFLQPENPRD